MLRFVGHEGITLTCAAAAKARAMTFYRSGRVRMTRAINRAMARAGNKQTNAEMIERMIQNSKNRFGGAIGRTVATSLVSAIDSGVAFQTAEFLFFNDNEEDDGT